MKRESVNPETGTQTFARARIAAPLTAILSVQNAPATPPRYVLSSGTCRIGAGSACDIVIQDATVSRAHVELALSAEGVAVRDLGSRNGTFFQEQRVESVVLALGSVVRLGRAEVRIDAESMEALPPAAPEITRYGDLHGASAPMRQLFAILRRLEGSLATVLIEGESGTGKELIARALHEQSLVQGGPFVAINCGALDRELVRSELFGHKRGAFTGAVEQSQGAFEAADGGTLFLDEIGDLPLEVQPILLRALESSAIVRVGESNERPVKVRVVAATNHELEADVAQGHFREDLFYRLGIVRIHAPPLRERADDIEILARHFAGQLGLAELPPDVLQEVCRRTWPGNVRQLRGALQSYAAVGALPSPPRPGSPDLEGTFRAFIDTSEPYASQKEHVLQTFTRVYLTELLESTGGNRSDAARISGIERSYLNKLANRLALPK